MVLLNNPSLRENIVRLSKLRNGGYVKQICQTHGHIDEIIFVNLEIFKQTGRKRPNSTIGGIINSWEL